MQAFSQDFIGQCRSTLLEEKARLINMRNQSKADFLITDTSGDEADQSQRNIEESRSIVVNEFIRKKLIEIDMALFRIQSGSFGFCEETGEAIETERLSIMPWTNLSVEGAEIRESLDKKYAR